MSLVLLLVYFFIRLSLFIFVYLINDCFHIYTMHIYNMYSMKDVCIALNSNMDSYLWKFMRKFSFQVPLVKNSFRFKRGRKTNTKKNKTPVRFRVRNCRTFSWILKKPMRVRFLYNLNFVWQRMVRRMISLCTLKTQGVSLECYWYLMAITEKKNNRKKCRIVFSQMIKKRYNIIFAKQDK